MNDASEVGSFVGEPVHLDEQVLYPVKNYGSAVTPLVKSKKQRKARKTKLSAANKKSARRDSNL